MISFEHLIFHFEFFSFAKRLGKETWVDHVIVCGKVTHFLLMSCAHANGAIVQGDTCAKFTCKSLVFMISTFIMRTNMLYIT